jgi:hypothetical protein
MTQLSDGTVDVNRETDAKGAGKVISADYLTLKCDRAAIRFGRALAACFPQA